MTDRPPRFKSGDYRKGGAARSSRSAALATGERQLQRLQPAAVAPDLARRVVARHAADAAARVGTGAAHVEAGDGCAVVAVAEHRPRRPELVERHLAMHDVAADQSELALEVQRRQRDAADNRAPEAGSEALDGV